MKFKKLIPALCMLLISAVLVGTSTFAWFSMNKTVTATGMTVSAVSDNVFLQIRNSAGNSNNQAKTEAEAVSVAAALYPVDYTAIDSTSGAVSWGKTTSDDPADPNYTAKASLDAVAAADLGDYVWSDTFDFWIAENPAGTTGENLKITSVTATITSGGTSNDISEALRVLVVGADGAQLWYNTGASEDSTALSGNLGVINYKSSATAPTGIIATVPNGDTAPVTATVYLYYCGNDDSVYTDNAQSLDGLDVEITFAVD